MLTRRDFLKRPSALADRPGPDRPRLPRPDGPRRGARARRPRPGRRSSSTAATTGSTPSSRSPTRATPSIARRCGSPSEQLIKVNDQRRPAPGACGDAGKLLESGPAGDRARASAIPTRTARTSRAWRSGRRPGSTPRSTAARAGSAAASTTAAAGDGVRRRRLRRRRHAAGRAARPARRRLGPRADRRPRPGPRRLDRREPPASTPAEATTWRPSSAGASLDAYATADRMAELARRGRRRRPLPRRPAWPSGCELVARLLKAGLGTRVFYTIQSGYDTHAGQLRHALQLLCELSGGAEGVPRRPGGGQAGRPGAGARLQRVRPHASPRTARPAPTTARPARSSSPARASRPAWSGTTPSCSTWTRRRRPARSVIDFRRVYATVLEDWLGLPAKAALGATFEPLPLFCRT